MRENTDQKKLFIWTLFMQQKNRLIVTKYFISTGRSLQISFKFQVIRPFLDEIIADINQNLGSRIIGGQLQQTYFHQIWHVLTQLAITCSKVNNRITRIRCEICSKLTIKNNANHQWRRSSVFIVNFGHMSQLGLVFLLLTLKR